MNRKTLTVVTVLLVLGAIAGAIFLTSQEAVLTPVPERGTVESQKAMHDEFPGVPETNRYVRESADQIMDRFASGTGIVFLGFKECPWCQKMAPMINRAAEDGGANIYYLDIRKLNDTDPDTYQSLISILLPYLPKDENGQSKVSTPDISFVRNGEIVWRYKMDPLSDEERTPDAYWTEARKDRVMRDFNKQIKVMRKGD